MEKAGTTTEGAANNSNVAIGIANKAATKFGSETLASTVSNISSVATGALGGLAAGLSVKQIVDIYKKGQFTGNVGQNVGLSVGIAATAYGAVAGTGAALTAAGSFFGSAALTSMGDGARAVWNRSSNHGGSCCYYGDC